MIEIARSCLLLVNASGCYEVVADVERYHEFLPGCEQVAVLQRGRDADGAALVEAQVTVRKAGVEYQFITLNKGVASQRIEVSLKSGPFERLEGVWHFKPLGDQGCRVNLQLVFEANGMLATLLNPMAQKAADRMVDAFSKRINAVGEEGR